MELASTLCQALNAILGPAHFGCKNDQRSCLAFISQHLQYCSSKMGGGRRYPYPKWVWSPAGGWWPSPTKWKRDSAIFLGVTAVACYLLYNYAEANTVSVDFAFLKINMCHFSLAAVSSSLFDFSMAMHAHLRAMAQTDLFSLTIVVGHRLHTSASSSSRIILNMDTSPMEATTKAIL